MDTDTERFPDSDWDNNTLFLGGSLDPDSQADPRLRVTLQTVRRPPSRAQLADWYRMRAAMKVYDGGGPVSVPEAAGHVSLRSDDMMPMNGSQKEEEEEGVSGRKRKVFMVKNDEDSDGSEMSCSSLSSVEEESPLLLSSAARTRPLSDASPVLTKVTRRTKIAPTPQRSILKRTDSRNSTENPSTSPAHSEMQSQKSDRILAVETPTVTSDKCEQLPAPLKRRRISWDIPGQNPGLTAAGGRDFQNEEKNKETGENSNQDQISESLLCRVKG
jgi:hypothetical protein